MGYFVDEAKKGNTYNFKQFIYKNDSFGNYITISSSLSTLEETEAFEGPLAKPDIGKETLANKELTVNLLDVSSASQYISCSSCRRKIESEDNPSIAFCSPCNLTQIVSRCSKQWIVKLFLQSSENPNHKFSVTAFNNIVHQLVARCFTDNPLDQMTPKQLTNHLITDIDEFHIVYDTVQKKIIELP